MSTTIVLLTVILGALLYGCVGEDVALTKEGKEALKKVGFIHITKTGGTAIEKSIYSKYLNSFGHKQTIRNYSRKGDVAICVLRHPVTRLVSMYNYWRYGSEMYSREVYWKPPVNSLNDFITAWRDITHPKHRDIVNTLSGGRGFTWAAHFYPQSYWLPDDVTVTAPPSATAPSQVSISTQVSNWLWGKSITLVSAKRNVIIVRHTNSRKRYAKRVSSAFSHALRELNMTKSDSDLNREKENTAMPDINVSNRLNNDTNTAGLISATNLRWLREYFKRDFELVESAKVQFYAGKGQWMAVF